MDLCDNDDILQDLSDEQRQRIERQMTVSTYMTGHTFYSPDDNGDRLLFLREGRVRLYKLSPEGRALTLHVLEAGSVFGEAAISVQWYHDSFAEAMTECTVAALGRDAVRRLLTEHPMVAFRVMDVLSRRLRSLERKLADIAFRSVPQRLAATLLSLADCQPQTGRLPNPAVVRYTHQQLAEMIGSYRETVTKVIGEFREANIIKIEDDAIQLTDLEQLEELAGR
jgi:CRP-like cAMP-binding protein